MNPQKLDSTPSNKLRRFPSISGRIVNQKIQVPVREPFARAATAPSGSLKPISQTTPTKIELNGRIERFHQRILNAIKTEKDATFLEIYGQARSNGPGFCYDPSYNQNELLRTALLKDLQPSTKSKKILLTERLLTFASVVDYFNKDYLPVLIIIFYSGSESEESKQLLQLIKAKIKADNTKLLELVRTFETYKKSGKKGINWLILERKIQPRVLLILNEIDIRQQIQTEHSVFSITMGEEIERFKIQENERSQFLQQIEASIKKDIPLEELHSDDSANAITPTMDIDLQEELLNDLQNREDDRPRQQIIDEALDMFAPMDYTFADTKPVVIELKPEMRFDNEKNRQDELAMKRFYDEVLKARHSLYQQERHERVHLFTLDFLSKMTVEMLNCIRGLALQLIANVKSQCVENSESIKLNKTVSKEFTKIVDLVEWNDKVQTPMSKERVQLEADRLVKQALIHKVNTYLTWRNDKSLSSTDGRGYSNGFFTRLRHCSQFGETRAKNLKTALENMITKHDLLMVLTEHFAHHSQLNNHSLDTYLLEGIQDNLAYFNIQNKHHLRERHGRVALQNDWIEMATKSIASLMKA